MAVWDRRVKQGNKEALNEHPYPTSPYFPDIITGNSQRTFLQCGLNYSRWEGDGQGQKSYPSFLRMVQWEWEDHCTSEAKHAQQLILLPAASLQPLPENCPNYYPVFGTLCYS
jgi:hypothetical protein